MASEQKQKKKYHVCEKARKLYYTDRKSNDDSKHDCAKHTHVTHDKVVDKDVNVLADVLKAYSEYGGGCLKLRLKTEAEEKKLTASIEAEFVELEKGYEKARAKSSEESLALMSELEGITNEYFGEESAGVDKKAEEETDRKSDVKDDKPFEIITKFVSSWNGFDADTFHGFVEQISQYAPEEMVKKLETCEVKLHQLNRKDVLVEIEYSELLEKKVKEKLAVLERIENETAAEQLKIYQDMISKVPEKLKYLFDELVQARISAAEYVGMLFVDGAERYSKMVEAVYSKKGD